MGLRDSGRPAGRPREGEVRYGRGVDVVFFNLWVYLDKMDRYEWRVVHKYRLLFLFFFNNTLSMRSFVDK